MEIINSIGFVNFWGVTPSYNILAGEKDKLSNGEINILISNSSDIRHVLKTIYANFPYLSEKRTKLNFYLYESTKENIARSLFFLHLLHDRALSIKDRIEIFMESYGNSLLSTRTNEYISRTYKILAQFITNDKKYKGPLDTIFDLSCLTHKQRDEILESFLSWDTKSVYDIEKYRDDRVRYMLKERYDFRKNLFDWDYHMCMAKFAPVVKLQHYEEFRNTGLSFILRLNKYSHPNRTLSSYIEGREKVHKGSCTVRGYWGDVVNSPYIPFGIELDTPEEHEHFYKNNMINYIHDEQMITEHNLMKMLLKFEKNEELDYLQGNKAVELEDNKKEDKIDVEKDLDQSIDLNNIADVPLIGFENVKIIPLTGSLENVVKKKKFHNLFDFILVGFQSKLFLENMNILLKTDGKMLIELNSFMTSFNEKQKEEYQTKLKELTENNNFVLEDTSFKYIWKFLIKN